MQAPAAPNEASPGGDRLDRSGQKGPIRVALIGASVRAAAESARLAGFEVTGLDQFGDEDTRSACQRYLSLDGEMLRRDDPASPIENSIARIGNEMPLISVGGLSGSRRWLDSLPLLAPWPQQREAAEHVRVLDCLSAATAGTLFSIPAFSSAAVSSASDADFETDLDAGTRWLCKQLDSSGGLGTSWIGDGRTATRNQVMQEWVSGRPFGATLLSNGSEVVLLGVCRSRFTRKGRFPFVYCGSLGPVSISPRVEQGLIELAQRISLVTGLRGLFNLDFVADPAGPLWLLEINPRWSGSSELIERHLRVRRPEISLFSLLMDGLNGCPLNRFVRDTPSVSGDGPVFFKRIVFARRPVRFDRDAIERQLRAGETLHDIPCTGRLIRRGEPVCTLIRVLDGKQKDPMLRHRVLVDQLSGVVQLARDSSTETRQ